MRNREVLLGASLTVMHGGGHARGCRGPDSGPTLPLPGVQDDINLIVTCFNAVIEIVLKTYFRFLYTELRYCQHLPYGLTFEIKYMYAVNDNTDIRS